MVSDGSVILSSGHENHDVAVKLGRDELESILADIRVKRGLSPGQISSFVVLKINMCPHNLTLTCNSQFGRIYPSNVYQQQPCSVTFCVSYLHDFIF